MPGLAASPFVDAKDATISAPYIRLGSRSASVASSSTPLRNWVASTAMGLRSVGNWSRQYICIAK